MNEECIAEFKKKKDFYREQLDILPSFEGLSLRIRASQAIGGREHSLGECNLNFRGYCFDFYSGCFEDCFDEIVEFLEKWPTGMWYSKDFPPIELGIIR